MSNWSGELGDALDVREVIERKERLLQIMVSERVTDPAARDDILQEARIAVWKAMGRPHMADAYLHTAARRRIEEVRDRQTWTGHTRRHGQPTDPLRQSRTDSLDRMLDVGLMVAAQNILDGVEMAYHQGEMFQAIAALPANQREYVILRFWGGLTEAEIAAEVHRSVPTVQRWWSEAKGSLRASLGHLATAT